MTAAAILRRALAGRWGRRPVLHLEVAPAQLTIVARERDREVWAAATTYTAPADLAEAIGHLAAEAPAVCRRLIVTLIPPVVQFRTIPGLPPVKDGALTALVAHQARRFFRRNGHPLVTDARWLRRGEAPLALAVAAEEPLLEATAVGARAAGLVLEDVVPHGQAGLSLLPGSERQARRQHARRWVHRTALVGMLAWAAAAGLYGVRLVGESRAVDRALAGAQAPLAAVLAARRELQEAEATITAVGGPVQTRPGPLPTLATLTEAMPDSAVILGVTWDEQAPLRLALVAPHAPAVCDNLAAVWGAVHVEGAVMREAQGERFTVVVEVPQAAAPAPRGRAP